METQKLHILEEREDEHHLSIKIEGYPTAVVHRVKKATTGIGHLAWSNKKLFGIRETPFAANGLAIMEKKEKHGVTVFVNGRPDIKPEYADSFDTALGQLIKHNQEIFNVVIKHKEK